MLNAAKDFVASRAARKWLSQLISRYGHLQELKVDSRRKSIEATCLLEGEVSPITVTIANYRIQVENQVSYLRADTFHCSRPWLQKLLTDFGPRQRIKLTRLAALALTSL